MGRDGGRIAAFAHPGGAALFGFTGGFYAAEVVGFGFGDVVGEIGGGLIVGVVVEVLGFAGVLLELDGVGGSGGEGAAWGRGWAEHATFEAGPWFCCSCCRPGC